MAVASMTGFARVEEQMDGETRTGTGANASGISWSWEIRSVNGKGFDARFRLPPGYDVLESVCKAALAERIKRGSLNVTLNVVEAERPTSLRFNETVLNQVIALMQSLEGRIDAAPPRLDGLLAIRGVVETASQERSPESRDALNAALTQSFARAVAALVENRRQEGARLAQVLTDRLDEIEGLVGEAERSAAAQPDAIRQRFQHQLARLFEATPPLPEERLAQELALLVARADVREELDRLAAHIQAARDLLAEGEGVGRRLDFLCQEFNREANTTCSKSADLGLTRIGLALKAAIEQFREQVQNIE